MIEWNNNRVERNFLMFISSARSIIAKSFVLFVLRLKRWCWWSALAIDKSWEGNWNLCVSWKKKTILMIFLALTSQHMVESFDFRFQQITNSATVRYDRVWELVWFHRPILNLILRLNCDNKSQHWTLPGIYQQSKQMPSINCRVMILCSRCHMAVEHELSALASNF